MFSLLEKDAHPRFTTALLEWFAGAMRPLPWRQNYEPYAVWISEIMLQQTQMERAVRYFNAWMEQFPTLESVAAADEETVLKAWEGLGYYSRARKLRQAARELVDSYGGVFPEETERLKKLPGIGEYTAGAIASIAFNRPEPAVDANVERIFSRLYDIDAPIARAEVKSYIRKQARSLLPEGRARLFNQALMELGALICGKTPRCLICPVTDFCEALRLGKAASLPNKGAGKKYTYLEMATGLLMRNGRVFIQKRPDYGVWASLWEFPGGCLEEGESPEQGLLREFAEETELRVRITEKIGVVRHGYITNRVTLHGFFCKAEEGGEPHLHAASEGRWVSPSELADYAFPAGHRKLLERIGWKTAA